MIPDTLLTPRLISATGEIVSLNTGLSLSQSKELIEKNVRLGIARFWKPHPKHEAVSSALLKHVCGLIADDLRKQGLSTKVLENVADDLQGFYLGIAQPRTPERAP